MARFTSYSSKAKPTDSDTLLINDASSSSNKQVSFTAVLGWVKDKLGSSTIDGLDTTSKNVVGAINELRSGVNGKADSSSVYTKSQVDTALGDKVDNESLGDLSNLETTDKSSIVAAINEVAQSGGGGGGGSSTLSGLTDTSISGKADGQVLTYDGTSNKWVNRAPSGGGSVTVDTSLSGTSTNPVQNKIIKQALDSKAGTAVATTSANGLMSATDKSHLDSVYADYSAAIAALGA